VIALPPELLTWYKWEPFRAWGTMEWCGHRVEGNPVPTEDGRWRLIVVEGEAREAAAGAAFAGSLSGCVISPPHEH
jgi:hypothetical protein